MKKYLVLLFSLFLFFMSVDKASAQCGGKDFKNCGGCHSDGVSACVWRNGACKVSAKSCLGGGGGGSTLPACSVSTTNTVYPNIGSCSSLGSTTCQKDVSGKNTGYKCTCTDLSLGSPYSCKFYGYNCNSLDTGMCQIEGGGSPVPGKYCSANTCSIPTGLIGTSGCIVNHYVSSDNDDLTVTDPLKQNVTSATLGAQNCGAEQIDVQCLGGNINGTSYPACNSGNQSGCSISRRYPNDCGANPTPIGGPISTPTPTLSPAPIGGQCLNVKIYSPNWTQITNEEYFELLDNSQVYFCVAGSTNSGSFDKARFTINNVLLPETQLQRPGSTDYCQSYTIPAGSYSTTVQGEIHHPILGWL